MEPKVPWGAFWCDDFYIVYVLVVPAYAKRQTCMTQAHTTMPEHTLLVNTGWSDYRLQHYRVK